MAGITFHFGDDLVGNGSGDVFRVGHLLEVHRPVRMSSLESLRDYMFQEPVDLRFDDSFGPVFFVDLRIWFCLDGGCLHLFVL